MAKMTSKAKKDWAKRIPAGVPGKFFGRNKGYVYMAVRDKKEDARAYAKAKRTEGFLIRITNEPVVRGGRKVNRYMIWGTPK